MVWTKNLMAGLSTDDDEVDGLFNLTLSFQHKFEVDHAAQHVGPSTVLRVSITLQLQLFGFITSPLLIEVQYIFSK
jgi:hypothetical protein